MTTETARPPLTSTAALLQRLQEGDEHARTALPELAEAVAEGREVDWVGMLQRHPELVERMLDPAPGRRPTAPEVADRLRWIAHAPLRRRMTAREAREAVSAAAGS